MVEVSIPAAFVSFLLIILVAISGVLFVAGMILLMLADERLVKAQNAENRKILNAIEAWVDCGCKGLSPDTQLEEARKQTPPETGMMCIVLSYVFLMISLTFSYMNGQIDAIETTIPELREAQSEQEQNPDTSAPAHE